MKKSLLILLCFTALQVATTHAQTFKYGIRGGISTPDVKPGDIDSIIFTRGADKLKLKVNDANYGYHFGIWGRLNISGFYIQPEVVFNSTKVEYKLGKLNSLVDSVKTESFQNVDIPLMLGTKLGSFRINAGPVAHIRVGGSSDLTTTTGFSEKFDAATWGYQIGMGFDAGKVGIDFRYEGNTTKFGNQLNIDGKAYNFSKAPSRFVVSVAIAL